MTVLAADADLGGCVGEDGLWRQVLRPPDDAALRPALFLDRDGTLVEEVGHLRRTSDLRMIEGAAAAVAAANRAAMFVVVVSNQSGIGRGLFGWTDFVAVQQRLMRVLAEAGAAIDAVFACPHHAEARPPYRHPDHPARKPNPGLLLAAAELLPIDLARSWIIGDRASDLAAGRNAGLAGGVLVATGVGAAASERAAALSLQDGRRFKVLRAGSIADVPELMPPT